MQWNYNKLIKQNRLPINVVYDYFPKDKKLGQIVAQ